MDQFTFSIQFLIGAYMSIFESAGEGSSEGQAAEVVEVREKALHRAAYILLLWVLGIEIPRTHIVSNDLYLKQVLADNEDLLYDKIKEPDFISAKNENNSTYGPSHLIQPKIENLSNDDDFDENQNAD